MCSPLPLEGVLGGEIGFPGADGDIVYRFRNERFLISNFFPSIRRWDFAPDVKLGEGFYLYKQAPAEWTRNFSMTE